MSLPVIEKIAIEDFFRNPQSNDYKISPEGRYISYMAPYKDRMNVFIKELSSGDSRRLTSVEDRNIESHFWSGESFVLFLRDNGGDENHHLHAIDLSTGEVRDLTPFEGVKVVLVDVLHEQEEEVLISMNKKNAALFDVYRMNVKTGEYSLVADNPGGVSEWVTDHDGQLRIAVASDGVNNNVLYRETEADEFEVILTSSFKDQFDPLFFTFDNKHIYASSNLEGRDKKAIVIFDPSTGKEVEELYAHEAVDVEALLYSRKRKKITFCTAVVDKMEMHFFDEIAEKIYARIAEIDPDLDFHVVSANRDENLLIVRSHSDRSLGAYYFLDWENNSIEKLAEISPWLEGKQLAQMRPISYDSRDGLKIHGYLTLPVDYQEGERIPVVINPHGGPWYRDTWGFNPEVQFLANRGYAVLQMNFRGSVGYGRKFLMAAAKEWGGKMQDDVSDGVQFLVDEGIADPARVAIYGGSYGGYSVLAGMAFTPELYACGVDYVGVSNLFTFMETIPPYWKPFLDMMYEMVGHPENDKDMLTARSPVFHVDKIQAPLFVVQGAKDPRVNIGESDQIVQAMRDRGVQVEYMVKENEGHGFRNQENRFEFYRALESFLGKHL